MLSDLTTRPSLCVIGLNCPFISARSNVIYPNFNPFIHFSVSGSESSPRRLSSITSFGLQRIPSPRHPSPLVIDTSRSRDDKKLQQHSEPASPLVKTARGPNNLSPKRLHRTSSMPPRIDSGDESVGESVKTLPRLELSCKLLIDNETSTLLH